MSNVEPIDLKNLSHSQAASLSSVVAKYSDGPVTGIFTDGSCFVNPGPGGWGAVQVRDDVIIHRLCGADLQTTNNRMELTAAIKALEYCELKEKTQRSLKLSLIHI